MIPVVLVMLVMVVMVMKMIISTNYNIPSVYITKWVKPGLIDNDPVLVENLYLKDVLSVPPRRNPNIHP